MFLVGGNGYVSRKGRTAMFCFVNEGSGRMSIEKMTMGFGNLELVIFLY